MLFKFFDYSKFKHIFIEVGLLFFIILLLISEHDLCIVKLE